MKTANNSYVDSYDLSKIRSTPFPNRLLETAVTLPQTQARIILVIVRWTLGWKAGSRTERKASVSLTYRELLRLVGLRSPGVVGNAVAALVDGGIIDVLSDDGQLLVTSSQRRRYPGTLRFRISKRFVEHG